MRRAWLVVFTVGALTALAFSVRAPAGATLFSGDPVSFREEACAGRDVVEVGIPEKPLLLPCNASNFEELYLAYCTAEAYQHLTGEESPMRIAVKEQLVPKPAPTDVRETRALFRQLRQEAEERLGTVHPPSEVDFSQHFPPAMRQMTNDCGSCAMANGITGVQARQFPLWGSPWTPDEIVSPLSFSRKSRRSDCRLTMVEPFTFWRQEGAWTYDILPYGDGDCQSVYLSPEELELGYPVRAAEYRQVVFVRDADYGTYIGTAEDVKRAIALGKNVQLAFGPLGSTSWAHTLAIMGYDQEGVLYLNSWGANWGPNGDGTGIFTWEWLLTSGPIWPPFFSSPHRIWFYFNAAADWEGECDPAHVDDDYRGVCQAAADLSVQKSGPTGPVLAGTEIGYAIGVTNAGPDPAEDIILTDHLPPGSEVVSATVGCAASGGRVTCTRDVLEPEGEASFRIAAIPRQAGLLQNTVIVSSTTADPDPRNNTAAHSIQVEARADLVVTKTANGDRVAVGQPLTYTLTVANWGPSPAEQITAVDVLAEGLTVVFASPSCQERDEAVTCTKDILAADDTAEWEVVVLAGEPGCYTNTVTVSSVTPDPNTLNNKASAITEVEAQADLAIAKAASANPVTAGQSFSYTLTIANRGPSPAPSVSVSDTLPTGVTYLGFSGIGWTCESLAPMVRCERPSLGAGETATLTLGVAADDVGGLLTNTAVVSGTLLDPNLDNNVCGETTAVMKLLVSAGVAPDPVMAGQLLTYTLWVTNAGGVDLHATMTNTLPTHVSPGGVLTWTTTLPASGGVWRRHLLATTDGDYEGPLTNVFEVVAREGISAKRMTTSAVRMYRTRVFLPFLLREQ